MSIPVPIDEIPAQLAKYGDTPFLLTTRNDGRPHPSSVRISWHKGEATVTAGRGAISNIESHPDVVLLFPPLDGVSHSLLIDGVARGVEIAGIPHMIVRATTSVLHRHASA